VRSQRYDAAVTELGHAARERPDVARYAMSTRRPAQHRQSGRSVTHTRNRAAPPSNDRAILEALVSMHREAGHADKSQVYTNKLQAL